MRIILTTLLAFLVSLFVGEMVAQQVAVAADGTEEFVAVFGVVFIIAVIAAVAFLIAQLRSEPRRAAGTLARWSVVVLLVLTAALGVLSYWMNGDVGKVRSDIPIILGIILPAIVIVLADWLIVRWLARSTAPALPRFGRGAN